MPRAKTFSVSSSRQSDCAKFSKVQRLNLFQLSSTRAEETFFVGRKGGLPYMYYLPHVKDLLIYLSSLFHLGCFPPLPASFSFSLASLPIPARPWKLESAFRASQRPRSPGSVSLLPLPSTKDRPLRAAGEELWRPSLRNEEGKVFQWHKIGRIYAHFLQRVSINSTDLSSSKFFLFSSNVRHIFQGSAWHFNPPFPFSGK